MEQIVYINMHYIPYCPAGIDVTGLMKAYVAGAIYVNDAIDHRMACESTVVDKVYVFHNLTEVGLGGCSVDPIHLGLP
jgi:hypothetical protein